MIFYKVIDLSEIVNIILLYIKFFEKFDIYLVDLKLTVSVTTYYTTVIGQLTTLGIVIGLYQLVPSLIHVRNKEKHTYLGKNLIDYAFYRRNNVLYSSVLLFFLIVMVGTTLLVKPIIRLGLLDANKDRIDFLYGMWHYSAVGYFAWIFIVFLSVIYSLSEIYGIMNIRKRNVVKITNLIEDRLIDKYICDKKQLGCTCFSDKVEKILKYYEKSELNVYDNLYNSLLEKVMTKHIQRQKQIARAIYGSNNPIRNRLYRYRYGIPAKIDPIKFRKNNKEIRRSLLKIMSSPKLDQESAIIKKLIKCHQAVVYIDMLFFIKSHMLAEQIEVVFDTKTNGWINLQAQTSVDNYNNWISSIKVIYHKSNNENRNKLKAILNSSVLAGRSSETNNKNQGLKVETERAYIDFCEQALANIDYK